MKYYLVQKQESGTGCDYTIGCGISIDELRAESLHEAIKEATNNQLFSTVEYNNVKECYILEGNKVDLIPILNNQRKEYNDIVNNLKAKEKEKLEREQYEALKNKFEGAK